MGDVATAYECAFRRLHGGLLNWELGMLQAALGMIQMALITWGRIYRFLDRKCGIDPRMRYTIPTCGGRALDPYAASAARNATPFSECEIRFLTARPIHGTGDRISEANL